MTTARRTRLIRVPDLHAFRSAIRDLTDADTVVVVPTRSAARQLLGAGEAPGGRVRSAPLAPSVSQTRDELYECFRSRLSDPPRWLSAIERDVIAQAAARVAFSATDLNFRLRPGLVAEMLRFYDHLRRHSQSVQRFEELIGGALGVDDGDRGIRRMRKQTRFLAGAFREYERRVRDSGGCDEHGLRERLIDEASPAPVRHVIVTVADWIADPQGLFVADFDLLARIPGLERLDIVATRALLGSGFHERLHNWWPGIEEVEAAATVGIDGASIRHQPTIVTRHDAAPDELWWTCRDREEELVAVVRRLEADRRAGQETSLDRAAIVFRGPLPYLYLAGEVFGSARVPFQAFDTLPLAAEPTSAAIDLILDTVASNFTRSTLVALLASPHFQFGGDGRELSRQAVGALDRALSDARYLGDPVRLRHLELMGRPADRGTRGRDDECAPALDAANAVARELASLAGPAPASALVRHLATFWARHLRPLPVGADEPGGLARRESRARTAVTDALVTLAESHAAHDDPLWTIEDLALAVRRQIEDRTFETQPPDGRQSGLHLLDDRAARYGDFDDLTIVGLVEAEWPERPKRNIFYPPSLLKSLGWPSERDRRAAADAHFLDLIASASRRTRLSVFTLDDDALVSRSLQLDEVPRAGLSTVPCTPLRDARVFADEFLSLDPVMFVTLEAGTRRWADLRVSRTTAEAPQFHGVVPPLPPRVWSVSALETYLGCPFRFFAQHVLKLAEEPEDEEIMDPRRQGRLIHEVFETFFARWQHSGHRTLTTDNLDEARRLFVLVVDEALQTLSEAEAGLERTRLLGSPVAAGLGEAVMRMEAERPTPVVERLLEHELNGEFTFATTDGPRTIGLRGKADRIDLLADGTFRLVDYKLGWPPDRRKALQLPIYGLCAEQQLASDRGRRWTMSEASYLAFKGPRRVVPLFQNAADRDKVLADAQQRLVATIDAVSAGQFPPSPDDVYRCETCSYAAVCRLDYVGDV